MVMLLQNNRAKLLGYSVKDSGMGTAPAMSGVPRYVMWAPQLTRPTTSFARGCKLWSKERQFYETERHNNLAQFADRPYLHRQYPEIGKHYPGTWRVVGSAELDEIVARLTQPTRAHLSRADDIRERTAYVRFIVDREKAKDIVNRTQSATARLEGNRTSSRASQDFRRSQTPRLNGHGGGAASPKAAWTNPRGKSSTTLPAV